MRNNSTSHRFRIGGLPLAGLLALPALWAMVAFQLHGERAAARTAAIQAARTAVEQGTDRLHAALGMAARDVELFALTYPAPGRALSVSPHAHAAAWKMGIVGPDGRLIDSEPGFGLAPGAVPAAGITAARMADGSMQLRVAAPLSNGGTVVLGATPAVLLKAPGDAGFPGTLALVGAQGIPCNDDCVVDSEPLDGLALRVAAVIDEARALAGYRDRRDAYLAVTAIASLLILAAFAALVREGRQLAQAKQRLRAAIDGSLDAFFILTPVRAHDGTVTDFIVADINERAAAIAGTSRAELLGKPAFATLPEYRSSGLFERYCEAMIGQHALEEERELLAGTPAARWFQLQIVPLDEGVAVSARDISARKEQERRMRQQAAALRESEARVRTVADTIPAMVAYIDSEEVYRFHNRAYEPEFVDMEGGVVGRKVSDVVAPEWYERCKPYLDRALRGESVEFEDSDEGPGGSRTMRVSYIPQRDDKGKVAGFHVMRQDITAQHRERTHLMTLARQDPLTGLANRAGFEEDLEAAMQRAEAEGRLIAVMYLDLDRFKPVNDAWGHAAGDQLLVAVARRLGAALRGGDVIARLGGDEFAVLIGDLTRHDDASVAAAKLVSALQAPFDLDVARVSVTASVGVAVHVGGSSDPASLLACTDAMLYHPKKAGKNTWRVDWHACRANKKAIRGGWLQDSTTASGRALNGRMARPCP